MWKLYEIQISASINKVLLEHGHAHSFMCCLWLLHTTKGRVELFRQKLCEPKDLTYLLSGPLQKTVVEHDLH